MQDTENWTGPDSRILILDLCSYVFLATGGMPAHLSS